jgi:hypothetical protein
MTRSYRAAIGDGKARERECSRALRPLRKRLVKWPALSETVKAELNRKGALKSRVRVPLPNCWL